MNVVARQTIRTGHPASDDQELERLRAYAAAQGHQLQVQRRPDGGYDVMVVDGAQPAAPMAMYQSANAQPPMQPGQMMQAAPPRPVMQGAAPGAPIGICQACGRHAPTQRVTLHQNVGALVMRFPKRISGEMCRACISKYFWKYTTISFFFGWWGVISFFYTLVTIPMNIAVYVSSLRLPKDSSPAR